MVQYNCKYCIRAEDRHVVLWHRCDNISKNNDNNLLTVHHYAASYDAINVIFVYIASYKQNIQIDRLNVLVFFVCQLSAPHAYVIREHCYEYSQSHKLHFASFVGVILILLNSHCFMCFLTFLRGPGYLHR